MLTRTQGTDCNTRGSSFSILTDYLLEGAHWTLMSLPDRAGLEARLVAPYFACWLTLPGWG